MLTPEELKLAREWIADCLWADLDKDDIKDLTDEQVLEGVQYHYSGGIEAFRLACRG